MTRRTKIWLAAAAVLLVFVIAAWLLGTALALKGSDLWVLRGGLLLLGVIAAATIVWFFLVHGAPKAEGEARADDVDALMAAARAQLAGSRLGGSGSMGKLPLVLVLGPEGSAKTTSIVRSGLDPELLAGGVQETDAVAPTKSINVWYAQGAIFLEAAGAVARSASRFARLLRRVRPSRWRAVLAGRGQAPRAAVVCLSCDAFMAPGAADAVPAAARELRARLVEAARALGIRLPTYVVFTKADRIAYFTDYVQTLTAEEARDALGATLPGDTETVGLYADRQAARVGRAFDDLFRSLAANRLRVLTREFDAARKPGAYEFPRELRKMAPLATQFLVELGKPSQLQVSPFLRGFYFAGVRPVLIPDAVPAAAPARAAARAGGAARATAVFDPLALGGGAAPAPAVAAPGLRKIPQWVFLGRLFEDVILGDEAARRATMGGAGVNVARRALLAVAGVAALVAGVGFAVSWAGNRALERRAIDAARGFAALPAGGDVTPSMETLQRLDSLRAQVQQLRAWEKDGAPIHLRWGLYRGSALLPAARTVYFRALDKLLLAPARTSLVATLHALPPAPRPADDYGATYTLLKGYLMTTAEPARSTSSFLAPVLVDRWTTGRTVDSARAEIARRQFAFYADELPFGDPYHAPADPALVAQSRGFLLQFGGIDRIYQNLLADAAKQNPSVQFSRRVPNAAGIVVDSYEVPGAFTKGGWEFVQRALQHDIDRYFSGEDWVLGDRSKQQVDRAQAVAQIHQRYAADFLRHWRSFVQNAAVLRYASPKDAAQKLAVLSGGQSPLLALFALASQNTAVDTSVGHVMQPVQAVVPPTQTDKYVGESNQGYMTALATLQASVAQVAAAQPGAADAAVQQTQANIAAATVEARKIALAFRASANGIGPAVLKLLLDPITGVDPLVRNFGAGEMNGKGGAFCSIARPLLGKYPFDPADTTQASAAELDAVFRPQTGALWQLYNDGLQNALVKDGNDYAPKPGATPPVNPAFVAFFNRAADISDVLYRDGSPEPHFSFSLKPVLSDVIDYVTVTVEGQTARFDKKTRSPTQFTWSGKPNGDASVTIRLAKSEELKVMDFEGPFAVFRMFDQADQWQTLGPAPVVEWTVRTGGQPMVFRGQPVKIAFEVNLGGLPPLLRKGYFADLRCVSRVAQ